MATPDTPLFVKTHDFLLWVSRQRSDFRCFCGPIVIRSCPMPGLHRTSAASTLE